ncbi:MAG TPA: cytochrome c biogenesis protein ResB [Candidatus Limnocylindria bacterium]|nr:cytochrome c biogenesis protein ResB [Candidatus Limnocylindria bacterium]
MDRSRAMAAQRGGRVDRLARAAERLLRVMADPRLGLGLLVLAAVWNAIAAARPDGGALLDAWPYLVLLGAVLLTGLAAVAVRVPAAWREWRRPAPLTAGDEVVATQIPLAHDLDAGRRVAASMALRAAGYRVVERGQGARWTAAGVRRGWSRFAGLATHVALVLLVLGAAIGAAFSSETTFSLLPGDQALLDAARPGFTDALRLERLEAAFGADGRPSQLDTTVTFLHDGESQGRQLIQVNAPGSFDGYLVHAWQYGPAARLRVANLAGRPLLDGLLPLDERIDGLAARVAELPSVGQSIGVQLRDDGSNRLEVRLADDDGLIDAATLLPGETRRLGSLEVTHAGMDAYVTFLSRRDPGMSLLFAGAALSTLALAVAFWLPRRRATLFPSPGGLRVAVRGERFQPAEGELERIVGRIRESGVGR